MPKEGTTLLVEVDSELAAAYRAAYDRAMVRSESDPRSLAEFISQFLGDRLVEELGFVQTEYTRDNH